jgi:hypothetical protein
MLRFIPTGDGAVEVVCDIPPDYMRLLVEPGDGGRVSFDASDWWTKDGEGIFVTRSYPGQVFEAAGALMEKRSTGESGSIRLGMLHLEGASGDLRISYSVRTAGEEKIHTRTTLIAEDALMPRPKTFALFQNNPNPFNPSTVIRFTLPGETRVRLSVYNIAGQKVAVLFDGIAQAGYHTVRWDASGYPSGVYFYTLALSNGYASTRKMLLVK